MPRTASLPALGLLLLVALCAHRAAAQTTKPAVTLPAATTPARLDLTPGKGVNLRGQERVPGFGIKGTEAQLIVTIKINPKAGPNCGVERFIALRRQAVTDTLKMLKLTPEQANLIYIQGTPFPDVAGTSVTANLKWYTVGAYGRWPNAAVYNAFQKAIGTTAGVKATRECTLESIRVGTMTTLSR